MGLSGEPRLPARSPRRGPRSQPASRQHREALAILEKLLAWNPNDNQGVRYLIGSEYLRAGETEKAAVILEAEAHQYPPLHYELALLRFRAGDLVAAATSLRRGFVANGYIAEMLSGALAPAPLAIWHGWNFAEPETARDYLAHGGDTSGCARGAPSPSCAGCICSQRSCSSAPASSNVRRPCSGNTTSSVVGRSWTAKTPPEDGSTTPCRGISSGPAPMVRVGWLRPGRTRRPGLADPPPAIATRTGGLPGAAVRHCVRGS